ncbi:hypothetical protein CK203_117101 [Vitis vinifera]|uniref:Uncharacterized protein n=1 Tax=Vitis vinifera TaxID=29760 RepID=A0A438DAB9_VITVI|nr:hypothetical protein CK203_117101 [Vitis vinifera]
MYISSKDKLDILMEIPSTARNRSFTQEMANRKCHCQGMVDQFDGPFLDCQLYPLPNCKNRCGILLLQPILMGQIHLKSMISGVVLLKYNSILQEDRVYTFLYGLDDRLDKTRSDVLQLKPFLIVEQAYAFVRREDVRYFGTSGKALHIFTHNNDDDWILDSSATDHMTFDSNDFSNATQPRRSCATNAMGSLIWLQRLEQ